MLIRKKYIVNNCISNIYMAVYELWYILFEKYKMRIQRKCKNRIYGKDKGIRKKPQSIQY